MIGLKTMGAVIFLYGSFFSNISAQGRYADVMRDAKYTVKIKEFGGKLQSKGSGTYFEENGRHFILTASHVNRTVTYITNEAGVKQDSTIEYQNAVIIYFNNDSKKPYIARLILNDPSADVAIFELSPDSAQEFPKPARWGDSEKLKKGTEVVIISATQEETDIQFDGDAGVISRIEFGNSNMGHPRLIEINLDIHFGSSGAPIVNLQKEVVGMVVGGGVSPQLPSVLLGPSYAVPINDVIKVISEIDSTGKLVHVEHAAIRDSMDNQVAFITCMYPPPLQDCPYGSVVVMRVNPGSEAELNGLKVGDVVQAIDSTEVESLIDLSTIIAFNYKPGNIILLTIWRPSVINRKITIPLRLGKWRTNREY